MVYKMKSFKQYITEMAMSSTDDEEKLDALKTLNELGNSPILWRGQRAGRKIGKIVIPYSGIVKVTQEKESFKGALEPKVVEVITKLGFKKKPVFCTLDKKQASIFGPLGAVIPKKPFIIMWNDKIRDLLVDIKDKNVDAIVDSYHKSKTIESGHIGEILVMCDEYFWMTPDKFIEIAKKSKFNEIKSINDINTYSDLFKLFKAYESYLKWMKSK